MNVSHTQDPELLLAHAGFIRAVARSLVSDPQGADDVEQQTWVAALQRSEPTEARDRPWLVTVARNAARMRWRSEGRRRKREQAALRTGVVPTPAEVLEREEARRAVVRAVLQLPPTYRDVVMLRYFEELSNRKVARRLQLPVETVRTRLRRARERLRAALVEQDPERDWRAALVPLAFAPKTAALTAGGATANKLVPIAVVGALLLAAGTVLWLDPWTPPDVPHAPVAGEDAAKRPILVGKRANPRPADDPPTASVDPRFDRSARERGQVAGVVLDPADRGVPGATVKVLFATGVMPAGLEAAPETTVLTEIQTDATGHFVVTDVPVGTYEIEATKVGIGTAQVYAVAGPQDAGFLQVHLKEPSAKRSLTVRVVDAHAQPVSGAAVTVVRGSRQASLSGVTDASGRARFLDVSWPSVLVRAQHGQLVAQSPPGQPADWDARSTVMELVLGEAGALEGRVVAPAGAQLPRSVQAWMLTQGTLGYAAGMQQTARVDAEGRYRFEALAAGEYAVRVEGTSLRVERGPPREPDWQSAYPFKLARVTVDEGRSTTHDITLVPGGTLRGRATTPSGQPIVGARIEARIPTGASGNSPRFSLHGLPVWRLDSPGWHYGDIPFACRVARSDAEGRWELSGMLPSKAYRVRVVPQGDWAFAYKGDVAVADGKITEFDTVLRPAGALEVVTEFNSYWGVREIDAPAFSAIWIAPRGPVAATRIPRLAEGRYELMTGVSMQNGRTPQRLATFEIHAGKTTFLNLHDDAQEEISVRVVRQGRPVAGARVTAYGFTTRITDADGRATWRSHNGHRHQKTIRVQGPELGAVVTEFRREADADLELALHPGVLNATFLDAGGRGVPDARFTLTWRPDQPRGGGRGPRRAKRPAKRYGPGEGTVRRAVSIADGSGQAHWSSLPEGRYHLLAEDPRTGMRAHEFVLVKEATPESVTLQGYEPADVRVRVVNEEGHVVPSAHVTASGLPGLTDLEAADWSEAIQFNRVLRTDEDGEAVLRGVPVGALLVGARLGGWPGARGSAKLRTTFGSDNRVEVTIKKNEVRFGTGGR